MVGSVISSCAADYNTRRTEPRGQTEFLYRKGYGIGPEFKMTSNRAYLHRVTYAYTSDDVVAFRDKFGELALAAEFFIQSLEALRDLGLS